ncbi:MAG TPA: ATP synthase F0 subunit C [Armatimonadota bacterium]|nr:ATP synthase F0 subunit C [Armatimonadota bacterium]
MWYFGLLALGLAIGTGIAAQGCGQGQGRAVAAALEGIARQPEAAATLQTVMIIGLAMIESLTIFAFVTFLIMFGHLPSLSPTQAVAALGIPGVR